MKHAVCVMNGNIKKFDLMFFIASWVREMNYVLYVTHNVLINKPYIDLLGSHAAELVFMMT